MGFRKCSWKLCPPPQENPRAAHVKATQPEATVTTEPCSTVRHMGRRQAGWPGSPAVVHSAYRDSSTFHTFHSTRLPTLTPPVPNPGTVTCPCDQKALRQSIPRPTLGSMKWPEQLAERRRTSNFLHHWWIVKGCSSAAARHKSCTDQVTWEGVQSCCSVCAAPLPHLPVHQPASSLALGLWGVGEAPSPDPQPLCPPWGWGVGLKVPSLHWPGWFSWPPGPIPRGFPEPPQGRNRRHPPYSPPLGNSRSLRAESQELCTEGTSLFAYKSVSEVPFQACWSSRGGEDQL